MILLGPETQTITETWLREILAAYRSTDDVFRDEFLGGVIFTRLRYLPRLPNLELTPSALKLLESLGTKWFETMENDFAHNLPPPGPYRVARQWLREIVKLYDDTQGAFIQSLIPLPRE